MTSCYHELKYHCIERSDEKQSRLHPTFGHQDVREIGVQIQGKSVKSRPKQLENCCRIALGRLLESFGMHFGPAYAILKHLGCSKVVKGSSWNRFGGLLERPWAPQGLPRGAFRDQWATSGRHLRHFRAQKQIS